MGLMNNGMESSDPSLQKLAASVDDLLHVSKDNWPDWELLVRSGEMTAEQAQEACRRLLLREQQIPEGLELRDFLPPPAD